MVAGLLVQSHGNHFCVVAVAVAAVAVAVAVVTASNSV
jgi:hypothetical protein